ncbi:MAG: manganese efflux pump [Eubacteriales bacterium]|nr:manganese efflux pump [Eubacteriales bacterium]
MLEILLLVTALSMDTFVASIAYGANEIHLSWKEVLLINGICAGVLGLALCLGTVIDSFVPETLTKGICFVSLLLLGIVKLLDYGIKKAINTKKGLHKDIEFTVSKLHFIITIYGNPMAADKDSSRSISTREAVFLAFAMSLDSLIAGTLAAFLKIHIALTVGSDFIMGILMMCFGLFLGRKMASKSGRDLSWLGGLLFLLLAFLKVR